MPRLTVSFVLYHTPLAEVERAIAQVHAGVSDAQVVLVDNSPLPNPLPPLDDERVTVIRPNANLGYGRGHNLAFPSSAAQDYHAVLNTDLAYGPEVFPTLIGFMNEHRNAGLVMPRVCYPDGAIQHLCRLLPHPMDVFGRGFFAGSRWVQRRNDRYEFRNWSYDRVAGFPFLSGCFMMIRRSVIDEIGGFDERFFMYGEDVDLSRRINARYETLFVPDATVHHEYRSQGGGYRRMATKVTNMSRYFNKWGWWVDRDRDRRNRLALDRLEDYGRVGRD